MKPQFGATPAPDIESDRPALDQMGTLDPRPASPRSKAIGASAASTAAVGGASQATAAGVAQQRPSWSLAERLAGRCGAIRSGRRHVVAQGQRRPAAVGIDPSCRRQPQAYVKFNHLTGGGERGEAPWPPAAERIMQSQPGRGGSG